MLGLVTLGITVVMIYTLVKNALMGVQLSSTDSYSGPVDLIIPITSSSEFYLEPWLKNLSHIENSHVQTQIHILIDESHPSIDVWKKIHEKLPCVEIHTFGPKPLGRELVPWMIEQFAPLVKSPVVILGDAELVPTQQAFSSIGKLVIDKPRSYFVLPQTKRLTLIGEAVAVMNPTLALASIFGIRRFRRNFSHPLISISQGWMAMPLVTFNQFDWSKVNIPSWKEALAKGWDLENKSYALAFGEKQLFRFYPEDFNKQFTQMKSFWANLWPKGERIGLFLFLGVLFVWSFPIFCIFTHPFWSLASIFLLVLYRFFTKIVFQESWRAMILHPVGALIWILSFILWGLKGLKTKYDTKGPLKDKLRKDE